MKRIKLYEAYNRDETLLGLAKMGLRTNRREVFDLAISRGFKLETNFNVLKIYCIEVVNYNSMEWIYEDKEHYQFYINSILRIDCHSKNLTTLKGIERLTNLTVLYCQNNNLTDLKGIENLTLLTYLRCNNNKITSLKGIEGLKQLTDLFCHDNKITSLKEIEKLTNISNFNSTLNPLPQKVKELLSNTNMRDITPIQKYYREN